MRYASGPPVPKSCSRAALEDDCSGFVVSSKVGQVLIQESLLAMFVSLGSRAAQEVSRAIRKGEIVPPQDGTDDFLASQLEHGPSIYTVAGLFPKGYQGRTVGPK